MASFIPIIISLCSLAFAVYSALKKDNKENTTAMTTVIVKLEALQSGISDIKSEIASLKDDQRSDHDNLIKLEASVKSAWKQIDKLTGTERED